MEVQEGEGVRVREILMLACRELRVIQDVALARELVREEHQEARLASPHSLKGRDPPGSFHCLRGDQSTSPHSFLIRYQ
jgi:hypothetical protein